MEGIEELFSKSWSVRANIRFYLRCGCFLVVDREKKQLLRTTKTPSDDDRALKRQSQDDDNRGIAEVDSDDGSVEDIDTRDNYADVVMYCTAL